MKTTIIYGSVIKVDSRKLDFNLTDEQRKRFEEGVGVNKYYIKREINMKKEGVELSSRTLCRIHQCMYNLLSEEDKKKYVEEPNEN